MSDVFRATSAFNLLHSLREGSLGGSPQMIFEHYRELVTERAAKAWFTAYATQGSASSWR
jgi:hypothetical protein